jgi:soluble lytic murein transglycosylase-like protein
VRHEEVDGNKVRLFFKPSAPGDEPGTLDLLAERIVRVEVVPDPPAAAPALAPMPAPVSAPPVTNLQPTPAELSELLAHAGTQHNIDADLLASLVQAESAGHARAVSRTGARGLMQLMPGTASAMGVHDAFVPGENVEGGTRYLDELLTKYHDNIALALAAYNAGPAAVDRYHGIPPYRETRAYVARVIREFNRRKTTLLAQAK